MKKYLIFISPLIFLLSLVMLFCFKTVPKGKLWDSYSILYMPLESHEDQVLEVFKELEINEHFELSNQYIPLNYSAFSPEITMLRLNSNSQDFSYLTKRNAYFFDKSGKYKLFYIPSKYKKSLKNCQTLLAKKGIKAGIDASASYPFAVALISLLLFIFLSLYSKNRTIFIAAAFPLLVFAFTNPFYSAAAAYCLMVLSLFLFSNVFERKGWLSFLLANYFIPLLLFFALLLAFASSLKCGFMFIISLCASVSGIYYLVCIKDYLKNKKSFVPVYIRPARKVSLYAEKKSQTMILLISSLVFLTAISIISNTGLVSAGFSKISLPAANGGKGELVNLNDYYDFAWNVSALPYRSLNKSSDKNYIEYPRYSDDGNKITENKLIKAYNQNYKNQLFDQIDLLPFNAIEKVLKSQKNLEKAGYTKSASLTTGIFAIIMMFISLSILLFIYISSIIRKGAKG